MIRITRRRVLAALLLLLLVAFLLVKLAPAHGDHPPIVIRSEGSDQQLTRSVLTIALKRLFPKGNGTWKLHSPPNGDPGSRCVALSAGYRSSQGRAVTAAYLFAGWLEVRLADYAYPDATDAAAQGGSQAGSRAEAACEGQVVAEGLRRVGYVVGRPHVSPSTSVKIGEGGRSLRIEVPTRYKGQRREWDLDSTSVRRGRLVLVVATLTPEPFQQANQGLAGELLPSSG